MAQSVKNLPAMQETRVRSLGWEDPLEEGKATHSDILPTPVFWPGEFQGLHSPQVLKESDVTERLFLPFPLHPLVLSFTQGARESQPPVGVCSLLYWPPWVCRKPCAHGYALADQTCCTFCLRREASSRMEMRITEGNRMRRWLVMVGRADDRRKL